MKQIKMNLQEYQNYMKIKTDRIQHRHLLPIGTENNT